MIQICQDSIQGGMIFINSRLKRKFSKESKRVEEKVRPGRLISDIFRFPYCLPYWMISIIEAGVITDIQKVKKPQW